MIPTTLVRITDLDYPPIRAGHQIFTSLEGENPGRSIKDRIVYGELNHLLDRGEICAGDTIAEITAGSTGLSLAYYCHQWNLKCSLFVPNTLKAELIQQLKDLGADLHLVDPQGAYEKYETFIQQSGFRKFDQFGNLGLRRHYQELSQVVGEACKPEMILGAVGTGHSLLGIAGNLPAKVQVFTAEPLPPAIVSGIRNLKAESFGDKDPCPSNGLNRIELTETEYYARSNIETDQGRIAISDSFRVVLGAAQKRLQSLKPISLFAIGSSNFRE